MTATSRPARQAHQLAQLLDQTVEDQTGMQQLASRLVTLAHLLWSTGELATQRAHDQAPGVNATNTDPGRSHGGDPTQDAALRLIKRNDPDPTATLQTQLIQTINDLDTTERRATSLIAKAITVHRRDDRPTAACSEVLCTEASAPGRLGYCENDYRRRLRWAQKNPDLTIDKWDPKATPIDPDLRTAIHHAPPLTTEQHAARSIRKRRKAV